MRTPPLSLFFASVASAIALFAACTSSNPQPVENPPPRYVPPPPTVVPTADLDAGGPDADAMFDDGGDAGVLTNVTVVEETAGADAKKPSACPAGMQLVDGEYCSEVEHNCLKSWYDKSNKKKICEEFAPTAKCVGKKTKKRFCIDTYEWPNKKGERPEVMNHFYQAQVKCAAVGKRLCTESEWTFACEGPNMTPFPYGFVRDAKKCNGDHPWDGPNMTKVGARDPAELARLWKGVRSGSQPDCVSAFGVADMPANADEIASTESPKAKYDSATTGGPWYKGVRNQCRPKIYTHNEDFYYYYLSFRCCAEADGKTTDPRTPRQIKEGWKFSKVEQRAQFTMAKMQDFLKKKEQNNCTCPPKDILCKTMCGTLLGPNAVDATH
ncbi:MAG: SUMF1/EgtB/PvdO family nonheme iron enzyme [Polyangiaceae bacterium]|nr:SUMF1/EgtB/PvdO family nonheme iron enzyme [Polyangiaceae bacterium]